MLCCLEVSATLSRLKFKSDAGEGVATNIQSSIQRENWDMSAYMASSYVHRYKTAGIVLTTPVV
jgi:hypothetical protein